MDKWIDGFNELLTNCRYWHVTWFDEKMPEFDKEHHLCSWLSAHFGKALTKAFQAKDYSPFMKAENFQSEIIVDSCSLGRTYGYCAVFPLKFDEKRKIFNSRHKGDIEYLGSLMNKEERAKIAGTDDSNDEIWMSKLIDFCDFISKSDWLYIEKEFKIKQEDLLLKLKSRYCGYFNYGSIHSIVIFKDKTAKLLTEKPYIGTYVNDRIVFKKDIGEFK